MSEINDLPPRDLSDAYQDGKLPPGKVQGEAAEEFRKTSRSFATGVTVVTVPTGVRGEMWGMTASSFNAVSTQPQLVAINVEKVARCHYYLERTDRFTVNLLTESQLVWAYYFANRLPDKMRPNFDWIEGCPVLKDTLSYFTLRKWAAYDGGDHTIFVGEVMTTHRTEGHPLVCVRGRFHQLGSRIPFADPTATIVQFESVVSKQKP